MSGISEATDASVSRPAGAGRLGRIAVGAVLLAAGVGLCLWAPHLARQARVPPFGYGLVLGGMTQEDGAEEGAAEAPEGETPTGDPAEGNSADEPAETQPPQPDSPSDDAPTEDADASPEGLDLEPRQRALTSEDLEAVRAALEPLETGPVLAVRAMREVPYAPPDGWGFVRSVHVAVVADAEADRALVPLAGDADVYLAADVPQADLFARLGVSEAGASIETVSLPESASVLQRHIFVRRRAAEILDLAPKEAAPNRLLVALARPGALEDAGPAALSLARDRRIEAFPVDLAIGSERAERRLGVAGLALELAGLAVLGLAALAWLGQRTPPEAFALRQIVEGAGRLARLRRTYGVVLACLAAVLAAGATGAAEPLAPLTQMVGTPPLARIGLTTLRPGASDLVGVFLTTASADIILKAFVGIGIPSLLPGLGLVAAFAGRLLGGAGLAPATLTLLERLPMRAAVAGVKVHAYAALAVGAWRMLLGTVRPSALGQKTHRMGFAAGGAQLYALLPLAMAILVAGALLETVLVAVLGWL
jgi:hypothetical protein